MDQPYDNEHPPLTAEDVSSIMQSSAKYVRNRFYGYTELSDVLQVLKLDMLEHPTKYSKLTAKGSADFLSKEFIRVGSRYAMKDKAAALGFKPEDLFFYSKKALREMIPVILESWDSGDLYEFEYTDRALWIDIDRALKALSASDLQIIRWAFTDDEDTVAVKLGLTEGAASMRVSRLLDKIREDLGGENPTPRRKSLSNAASQAVTRNQWDGEG
jgi:hypothetical protein